MNTERKLGDVELRDYIAMLGVKRSWRRTRAFVLASSCVLAFAAGRFGPWNGKHSADMTFQEAVALLDSATASEWHELGVTHLRNFLMEGMVQLEQIAEADADDANAGKAGAYAVLAMRHLAVAAINRLVKLDRAGHYPNELPRALGTMREALGAK